MQRASSGFSIEGKGYRGPRQVCAPAFRSLGCQIRLFDLAGKGASINSQQLLPAVDTRKGRVDTCARPSEAGKVRTFAHGAQVKMVTDAAASARMNPK